MYYTYIIRCIDNSLYTGITNDLERRMSEHFNKTKKCAKYTLNHTPVKLETAWITSTRVNASKLEYHIKKLSKKQKELLLEDNNKLELYLGYKIIVSKYKKISKKNT